jgi:hypothetical protein
MVSIAKSSREIKLFNAGNAEIAESDKSEERARDKNLSNAKSPGTQR